MATNPQSQFPERQSRPDRQPPHLMVPKRKRFPWPLLIIAAAVVILILIVALLPRVPHVTPAPTGAQAVPQPTGNQIQLTNLRMSFAPVGRAVYLDGLIKNMGPTVITGIAITATFNGSNGQPVGTQTRPVEAFASGTQTQDLTKNPIRVNESRPFRLSFENYPAGWNKQMPALTVATVTGTT